MKALRLCLTVPIAIAVTAGASVSDASQDRTARELKQLSPADAHHSTFFNGLGSGGRILDTLNSIDHEVLPARRGPARDASQFLASVACSADAVLLGQVESARSHPTADGQFLFTNYTFRVLTNYRARTSLSVKPGQTAQVVRVGGQITVEGVVVRAHHFSFPLLESGKQYVLMLSHIQPFGTFLSNDSSGQFALEQQKLHPLAPVNSDEIDAGVTLNTFRGYLNSVKCS